MTRLFPIEIACFTGAIHETIKTNVDLVMIATEEIKIIHHGYSGGVNNRRERNEQALLNELHDDGTNTMYLYHLAVEYCVSGRGGEAIKIFRLWDKEVTKQHDTSDLSAGYSAYIGQLVVLNEYEEARTVGARVSVKCRHNPGFCLNYGIALGHFPETYDLALMYLNGAKTNTKQHPGILYDNDTAGWKVYLAEGKIYFKQNLLDDAISSWGKGLEFAPRNKILLNYIVRTLTMIGRWGDAEGYLERLMKYHPEEQTDANKLIMANILYNTGREIHGLELCWSLEGGDKYIDQLLVMLLQDKQFVKIEQIQEFVRQKVVEK
jgi:tetratricopeptide (TPR) repeat protein